MDSADGKILIANDNLKVEIALMGAELARITDKNGCERLWDGDAKFWTGRAPVLFPYAGGLKDGYFEYRGKRYDNPTKHGFAKITPFSILEKTGTGASLRLEERVPSYPFDYRFTVRYALEGNALRVDYITENAGADEMYFGVGCHEAYRLDGGVEHYFLTADREEEWLHYPLEGAQILREGVRMGTPGKTFRFREEHFAVDALVFRDIRSRGVTLKNDLNEKTVRVDFEGFDHLLVWKKPRAGFLCIEPWVNPPEWVDGGHDITEKPGIVRLEPGGKDVRTHVITFG